MLACTTRRFLFVAACAAFSAASTLAQPRQHLVPSLPPTTAWQPPVLRVQDAEQPIRLRALKVDVEVSAGVAETRVQMEFFNPNRRVLEGKLQFPLASGQIVAGFALDVDGELRDAVPVEKARAQQVFEDIVRRRVDPGLLQTTLGNNYELRIYPLAPGKTRTVVLRLVEPATTRLSLPLAYAKAVDRFEVSLRYASATARPQIVSTNPLGLVFERDPRGGFVARRSFDGAVLPGDPLIVQAAASAVEITTEQRGGDTFFTLDLAVTPRSASRPMPRQVQIVWDASGSAAGRQLDRELALLDAYFKRAGTIAVTLTRFADVAHAGERFMVKNGDWTALRRALQATVYDGASHLGAVAHDGTSQEAIWFTDGLANYGAHWRRTFPVPAYMVHSSTSADPAALQAVAEASGGRSIDLTVLTQAQAADALLARGTQLVEVSALGAKEVVVESRHASGGRLVLAGILTANSADLTLRLRGADGAVTTRAVRVDAGRNESRLAALQWGRLTLASLEGDTSVNKARIRDIGRRFGLATRETSLLVLEQVDDYVRNEIEPPVSLRAAYDRLAATTKKNRSQSDAARLAQVIRRFEARVAWWNRPFPKDEPAKVLQIAKSQAGALGQTQESARQRRNDAPRDASVPLPMAAAPASPAVSRLAAAQAPREEKAGARSAAPHISIALKPAASNSAWAKRLQAADPESWHTVYLDERRDNAMSVGFFLDSADFFLEKGQRELGLRALSNLAEPDLQNRQVLRLLAYRLQQAGEVALALPIFERVLELAPNEPQSHRDLGLALAQSGQSQRAVDRLYEVVTGAWDSRFADADLIALAELNAVVAEAGRAGKPIDVSAIEPRLLKNLPLDLRVVLAWDADATDVDLHVIDPNGDEVYYGRNLSYQGGAMTRDATGGYGPEEFALRNAKPGKYRVEANFFGHRQQVLASSTGLMLWLSSGFGTPAQQDQRTTLRVKSEGGERVLVGEFEVKR